MSEIELKIMTRYIERERDRQKKSQAMTTTNSFPVQNAVADG